MRCSDNELEMLEEEIKENVEWLTTTRNQELEVISIENLEAVLTRFFNKKISLSL